MNAVIKDAPDGIDLATPYDRDFVNDLKAEIHYSERQWNRENKCWWVAEAVIEEAIEITGRHFEIIDARGKGEDEVEESQIEAEIAEIAENQKRILENKGRIEAEILDLSTKIARYSFRSKSSVKAGLARDRALLQHSLDNAAMPTEELAELQVRGLAAARRYLREN